MIIPVRCFNCNKVLSDKVDIWRKYTEEQKDPKKKQDKTEEDVFKSMNITRYCCKRMITTHYDIYYDTKSV